MNNQSKLIVLFLFVSSWLFAQEAALVPMQFNPVIKHYLRQHANESLLRTQATGDTLVLPFLDDFSSPGIYPDPNHWCDRTVFINDDFARNPITIGVATFDGMDAYGNAYDPFNSTTQSWADTLTSNPINLLNNPNGVLYTLADSIYLSFFYEKKGWGEAPETSDSLVLQFYNASSLQWIRQWSVRGGVTAGQDTFFTRVNIAFHDSSFFKNGFRFRFLSYGSLSGAIDIWNLDYVLLQTYPPTGFDSNLKEIAFVNRSFSLIHPYTSMPWKHLINNQSTYLNSSIDLRYKYLSNTLAIGTDFRSGLFDQNGVILIGDTFSANVNPLTDAIYSLSINPILTSPNTDSARFSSTHMLSKTTILTSQDDIRSNDSVVFKYNFYNYYSYDDGTSEVGFDLINAPGGKVAMRFDLAQADTLRAVRMLFVQQNASAANKFFTLKIWSSLTPETVIYSQQNCRPAYIDSIDGMATYVIPPTPVSGTIYIGFQQVAPEGLHLGYDRNTANNSKMFYSTTGTWNSFAAPQGSFMINAVIGGPDLYLGINEANKKSDDIFVYPNPATDMIYFNPNTNLSPKKVVLMDATGRVVLNKNFTSNAGVDIKNFPNGLYMLQFINEEQQIFITKKVLINH